MSSDGHGSSALVREPVDDGDRTTALWNGAVPRESCRAPWDGGASGEVTVRRRRSQAVPLATGTGLHHGAELIGQWIVEFQQRHAHMPPAALPREVIAWAATEAAEAYERRARATGFVDLALVDGQSNPALESTILEQRTLVEALPDDVQDRVGLRRLR